MKRLYNPVPLITGKQFDRKNMAADLDVPGSVDSAHGVDVVPGQIVSKCLFGDE